MCRGGKKADPNLVKQHNDAKRKLEEAQEEGKKQKQELQDKIAEQEAEAKRVIEELEEKQRQQEEKAKKERQAQIEKLKQKGLEAEKAHREAQKEFKRTMNNFKNEMKEEKENLAAQLKEQEENRKQLQGNLDALLEVERKREEEMELLRNYPPQPFQQTAYFKEGFNICVTGPSRAGKSTFVNTVRNLRKKDPGAAYVVTGQEGTRVPKSYQFDLGSIDDDGNQEIPYDCKLWDIPGHSTPNFPLETYLRDVGLRYFNAVILFTCDCFSEGDLKLMQEMKEHKVCFWMVRNKIDDTVKSAKYDGDDVEEVLQAIRDDIREQGVDRCFLISTRLSNKGKWDYPDLMHEIKNRLILDTQVARADEVSEELELSGLDEAEN